MHKANIMKLADGLFLESCREVASKYPGIAYNEVIVDNCCMQLVSKPEQFDVMVCQVRSVNIDVVMQLMKLTWTQLSVCYYEEKRAHMANIVNNCTTLYLCVGHSVSRELLSFDYVKRKNKGSP